MPQPACAPAVATTATTTANTANESPSLAWRADIDGLRAVAVLAVLMYHAFPSSLPGGFVGVDVFFAISGYLITGLLLADQQQGRLSMGRFYARRARRLFPALALVLTFTVVAVFLFASSQVILLTVKHSGAGALSFANIVLWHEAGYFDVASHLKPLLHLWSLGVEEQFYLVWPLAVLWLGSRRRLLRWGLATAVVVSLVAAQALNQRDHNLAFYSPFTRFWELGLGALAALAAARGWTADHLGDATRARALSALGLALIALSFILIHAQTPFPGLWALLPAGGATLVLWCGTHAAGAAAVNAAILSSRPAVYVGAISYPLYLWHWPLLALPVAVGWPPSALRNGLCLLLAAALAAATLHWVETPIRHSRHRRRALVTACGLLAVAFAVSYAIWLAEKQRVSSPTQQQLKSVLSWPPADRTRYACPPELARAEPALALCARSRAEAPTQVVWGDSHADHLYPGLVKADPAHTWLLLGHMSCPPRGGHRRAGRPARLRCPGRGRTSVDRAAP